MQWKHWYVKEIRNMRAVMGNSNGSILVVLHIACWSYLSFHRFLVFRYHQFGTCIF